MKQISVVVPNFNSCPHYGVEIRPKCFHPGGGGFYIPFHIEGKALWNRSLIINEIPKCCPLEDLKESSK